MQNTLNGTIVEQVKQQLEFYLDDINLLKDKYLQNLLKQSNKLDLKIFLNFNKIKVLLCNEQNPIQYLQQAVINSGLLTLNKTQDKLKRYEEFKIKDDLIQEIDNKTIYIENLPDNINQEKLKDVFKNVGQIKHISLPSHKNSKKTKGFGFIVFQDILSVQNAIEKYNNCIPTQFFQENPQKQQALIIYSKYEWLQYKQQFKKIKKEINESFNQDRIIEDNNKIQIEKQEDSQQNCLIKILQIPKNIEKNQFKICIKQLCDPKYIDFQNGKNQAILRFQTQMQASQFLKKYQNNPFFISNQQIQLELIQGIEEQQYMDQISKFKSNFRNYMIEKKNKKIKI